MCFHRDLSGGRLRGKPGTLPLPLLRFFPQGGLGPKCTGASREPSSSSSSSSGYSYNAATRSSRAHATRWQGTLRGGRRLGERVSMPINCMQRHRARRRALPQETKQPCTGRFLHQRRARRRMLLQYAYTSYIVFSLRIMI